MVFSQTSHKTQSILKVVDLDHLKAEKNQQVNSSTGVVTDGPSDAMPSSPAPAASYTEKYLKPEPLFESTMIQDTDCEFFQDLVQWCSAPAKEELVQTIDSPTKPEERAYNIDTPHTPFSPQGWDALDANSPYGQAGFYNTPVNPLSPINDGLTHINHFPNYQNEVQFQERFLDINSLPVVIEDLASEKVAENSSWLSTEPVQWTTNTHDTDYTKTYTNTHGFPFIDQEDSLDAKFVSVIPREVESNDVVISEYIISNDGDRKGHLHELGPQRRGGGLSVDVEARAPNWPGDIISTPEVLSYVEQMETEKHPSQARKSTNWLAEEAGPDLSSSCATTDTHPSADYEPITPKSESHVESDIEDIKTHSNKRRRHDSEDSDKTYTPFSEQPSKSYKRRKANIPIKDMIIALEGSQQLTKARRGRPPKRRESAVSSACSVDENSSCISTQDVKYRELRDKNNEASKRSRMNRKLKELQLEHMADELEERNKKLKVRAEILEEMTKKLKDALMTAILNK